MRLILFTPLLLACAAAANAQTLFQWHKSSINVGPNPSSIAVADLNGDGFPEILTSDRGRLADPREPRPAESALSFLVGGEDFKFTPQPQLRTGYAPYRIAIVNIDALPAPDILVANFLATRQRDLVLLRNLGENLFEPREFSVPDSPLSYTKHRDADGAPLFTVPGLTAIDVADLDGDGYRDVVATAWSANALVTFPGHPDTYFADPVITPLPGGPRDIVLTNLNSDGIPDAVVTLYSAGAIALMHGAEDGTFTKIDQIDSRGRLPIRARVADYNGDGHKDIAVAHAHADDSIVILLGPAFTLTQEILLGEERDRIEKGIRDLVSADFDGDGREDLAVACAEASEVIVLRNISPANAPAPSFEIESYTLDKGKPRALAAADLNADGALDIAVALWDPYTVRFLVRR